MREQTKQKILANSGEVIDLLTLNKIQKSLSVVTNKKWSKKSAKNLANSGEVAGGRSA